MFKLFNRNKSEKQSPQDSNDGGLLRRFTQGLQRTRSSLGQKLSNLLHGKKYIDDELFTQVEKILLAADIGTSVSKSILDHLVASSTRETLRDPTHLMQTLSEHMVALLSPYAQTLEISSHKPFVILTVGVNGAGKTTSVAKLSYFYKQQQRKVVLAAADTFRAAAVEQLLSWGRQQDIQVIHQPTGADSASVVYDAHQSCIAKKVDILIADTAGRLHTQDNLMQELKKIKRIVQKQDASGPHAILLVIDATIGQNALQQAKQFSKDLGVTGLIITKLDGSAKGGIIFSIVNELKLPIYYIGLGEGIDDLKLFDANMFVQALFTDSTNI